MRRTTKVTLLLVEDDPADQTLARRALDESELQVDLRIVSDGVEALDYLHRRGAYADSASSPRPDLILLDLNLPGIDGCGVLEHVRAQPELRGIPILVLTTSDHPADVEQVYALGANSYLTKPTDMARYVAVLRQVGSYWFDLVELPRAS